MSTTLKSSDVTFIDSEASLLPLLDSLANLAVDPPSLYISLEGITLGRHDSISILSLYIAPTKKTYLVDIQNLGESAFSATTNGGASLKIVLESSTIPKVAFDIRNYSHALFCLFHVAVDGFKDLQLMELASRTGSHEFVSGLMECIDKESTISAPAKTEWRRTNERVLRLFLPEKGGHNEVFNERPLKAEIIQYCKQNAELLRGLYTVYSIKLYPPGQTFWRVHVREATKNRIKLSQSSDYDGNSRSQAFVWDDESINQATESWNDEIMMEAMIGENVLNEEDHWVAAPNDSLDQYFDQDEDDHEEREDEWYSDTARDCIGWEEDMIKNGESF